MSTTGENGFPQHSKNFGIVMGEAPLLKHYIRAAIFDVAAIAVFFITPFEGWKSTEGNDITLWIKLLILVGIGIMAFAHAHDSAWSLVGDKFEAEVKEARLAWIRDEVTPWMNSTYGLMLKPSEVNDLEHGYHLWVQGKNVFFRNEYLMYETTSKAMPLAKKVDVV